MAWEMHPKKLQNAFFSAELEIIKFMKKREKIAHLTTVHSRSDTRIFEKETSSLASAGFETFLLVGDKIKSTSKNNVSILNIGPPPRHRMLRMIKQPLRIFRSALRIDANLYHIHDPELIPVGILLKKFGKTVVYDAHEDTPRDILSKSWISPILRNLISKIFEVIEDNASKKFDAVVCATPHINKRFSKTAKLSVIINNYPLEKELVAPPDLYHRDPRTICYIGTIEKIRGIFEIINALEFLDVKLILAGPFDSPETETTARNLLGWSKVDYRGTVDRSTVREIMANSSVGLVLLHPAPNHINAQPNKMFEYMSASLPVVGSNFPLWQDIIEKENAGICVDPLNPAAIAAAIKKIIDNPSLLQAMGSAGYHAVQNKYTWRSESIKLIQLYETLLLNN